MKWNTWLCLYFLFIVPVVENDLKLSVNHQFIATSLYNQRTQLIFITDIFRPKIKCTTLLDGTLCLCEVMRSVVFCQNFWQITQRLPGNWRGGGKRFSGAFRAGVPSPLACLLLARTFFLLPTTSKRLLRRIRRLSAVQIRGVSRTSAITAKFANFDQKKCKPSLQTKKGRNFGAFIVLKCRRIFRNLGEESKRKFVM